MTGRGAGFCAGYGVPGSPNPVYGAGGAFSGGRGGRGRRNRFYATGLFGWQRSGMGAAGVYPAERESLERQAQGLEQSLKAIRERLDALAAEEKPD